MDVEKSRIRIGLAGLMVLASVAGCQRAEPRYRNLVVVVIDALRSDHLASYGYARDTAPFLGRLAAEGIRLQGYSASSWTKTSVATLLTGLQPQRHGANRWGDKLPASAPFLAEILSRSGFATAGHSSNHFVGRRFGFHRGFASFPDVAESFPRAEVAAPLKARGNRVTELGLELAAALEPPFHLHLHYLDPHAPYVPERPWGREAVAASDYLQPKELQGRIRELEGDGPEIRLLIDQYDGAIREVDRAIEGLIEGLDELGLLAETLVVVTADHGEEFLEHGGLTHGKTLFEESLAVPFILWARDPPASYASSAVFHHVDFLPTVLAAVGVDSPENLDGRDLWRQVVTGRLSAERQHLFALDYTPGRAALALMSPPWKLVHRQQKPRNLLFDRHQDPGELHSLGEGQGPHERLLRRLIGWHNELAADGTEAQQTRPEADVRTQLEALGYVGGGAAKDVGGEPSMLARPLRFLGARPDGLFGEENPATFHSRIDPTEESPQLLSGWGPSAAAGRWSRSVASLVFPTKGGAARLRLTGTARHATRCSIRLERREIAALELNPGPFMRAVDVPAQPGPLVFFDLVIDPPRLTPQGYDLGLIWRELALEAEPGSRHDEPAL